METTPLATALSTYLSDPANAKAMMQTLVAAACASSADNAGATALGGNYVHLLVDKSTGAIKFRSEADDAAVASGIVYVEGVNTTSANLATDAEAWFNALKPNSTFFTISNIGGQRQLWFGYKYSTNYGCCFKMVYSSGTMTRVFESKASTGFVLY